MAWTPNVPCSACGLRKPRNRCSELSTATGIRLGFLCRPCEERLTTVERTADWPDGIRHDSAGRLRPFKKLTEAQAHKRAESP